MPLYLREADARELVTPGDAVEAVEASFARIPAGAVSGVPRSRLGLADGRLEAAAAVDGELGIAGVRAGVAVDGRSSEALVVYGVDDARLLAVIEAEWLGRLRAGAASAVAARHLARPGARTLGVIGAGKQAETQIACLRAALPDIDSVAVYARDRRRLDELCSRVGAEAVGYNRDAAEQDVVVTITTSRDPVLRGEWLRPGALVCAAGANRIEARELDNAVVERATFVCCDSAAQARVEAGDLVEPVERGVLDWLEVHELAEVVSGSVRGREREGDIVLFKSLGTAAGDLALAAIALRRARAERAGVIL